MVETLYDRPDLACGAKDFLWDRWTDNKGDPGLFR
jgi:hypothetical protein